VSFELRPMTRGDIDAVHEIEHAIFPTPWSRQTFAAEVSIGETRAWLVAVDGDEVVGYGGIMVIGDEAHIMNLAVREDARSKGVGATMLESLLASAVEMGASRATLEVRESNSSAQELYRRFGLSSVGVRPGYYSDTREDAVIMWGDLLARDAASPEAGQELILAIESSCDETAAAVMRGGTELLSSVIASQVDFHARFGGVVPEIASRKHTEAIVAAVDEALEQAGVGFGDLDAIAVTYGPGLVGALVVGVAYAKGVALGTGLPLVGVNHLEGHIFANMLADPTVEPPLVALLVSGGHTSLVHMPEWGVYHTLGETLDDAAGEAFDKVAKALGLGYPGGPILSRLASEGNENAIDFPRAMMRSGNYAFSLSGLKTSVINHIRNAEQAGREVDVPDLAASFQAAVVDVQVSKAVRAAQECGVETFCLAGGVAANPSLREKLHEALADHGIRLSVPPLILCTDNAAMIAQAAHFRFMRGGFLGLDAEAIPNLRLDSEA
jgi:N6-L-threonylcarbamoyladenine synthase/protein kinase Bud32